MRASSIFSCILNSFERHVERHVERHFEHNLNAVEIHTPIEFKQPLTINPTTLGYKLL